MRGFDEHFRNGQYSLASFFFALLLTVPLAQPFVKVEARSPVPYGVGAKGGQSLLHSKILDPPLDRLIRIPQICTLLLADV